jgi:hypothetical protein
LAFLAKTWRSLRLEEYFNRKERKGLRKVRQGFKISTLDHIKSEKLEL